MPPTTPTKQATAYPLTQFIGGLSGLALCAFWGRESDAIESRWNANERRPHNPACPRSLCSKLNNQKAAV